MGKIFTTSDDVLEIVDKKFKETSLNEYGVTLKVMSVTKAKEIFKISKASATTEFIAKKDGMVQLFIYEAAFDRLPDDAKEMLIEMVLSNVSYDTDKDKILVETNPFKQVFAMRKKYGNVILDKMELSSLIIEEIEEEEKEKKIAEREAKKAKKNNNLI